MGKLNLWSVEKLNAVFSEFFADLGYPEITARLDTEFSYWYAEDIITYTLFEMPLTDIGFMTYIKDTYKDIPQCSIMVLSLLHELGHHITIESLSKKKMLKSKKDKKRLAKKSAYSDRDIISRQITYCKIYDEMLATKKAIEILRDNYDYILSFESVWYEAVKEFYAKNNIICI